MYLFSCESQKAVVDYVVERVWKKVKKPDLDLAKYPGGLYEKVRDCEIQSSRINSRDGKIKS